MEFEQPGLRIIHLTIPRLMIPRVAWHLAGTGLGFSR
jgi:hypothetical protein